MADLSLDGYTVRGYEPSDAERLTAQYNEMERAVGGHPGFTESETRAIMTATVADHDADARLVFEPGGELVAAGIVATPPPGGFRVDMWGGVHPSWVGRGIGREVLTWQLARATEIHRAVAPDAEWAAETAVNIEDKAAIRMYERVGMTATRYFLEMLAPARTGIEAPLPDGLRAVRYEPGRYERELYEAHMEAFSDHWGFQQRGFDEWATYTVDNETFLPGLSRVAYDGDEIAGYVLSYSDADPDRAYVGQVGTRRPWRRRGLAASLLAEVLASAVEAGKGHVYLGVDADSPTGAVGVYERVGFEVEARAVAYRTPLA
jgi:ribosomal protein S18 acetylase RimI-like enzyme